MFKLFTNQSDNIPDIEIDNKKGISVGLNVKVKKTLQNAKMPVKGSEDAAAFDVFAAKENILLSKTGQIVEYDTGLSFELPKGYGMFVLPRSGVTTKTTLMLGNGLGLLDPDYRGSLKFQFRQVNPNLGIKYDVGDRIGQIVILPIPDVTFEEVEELSETKRGEGGFGSSGK